MSWDPEEILGSGAVTVRELSQHTTQVLKIVEEKHVPLVVTRHGKIVAMIAPTSMREVVDGYIGNRAELSNSFRVADDHLAEGKVVSASGVLGRKR